MTVPVESILKIINNPDFGVILSWIGAKKEHSLKTFSAPFPADNLHIHVHMGGRYSAFDEILSEIKAVALSK